MIFTSKQPREYLDGKASVTSAVADLPTRYHSLWHLHTEALFFVGGDISFYGVTLYSESSVRVIDMRIRSIYIITILDFQ